MPHCCGRVSEPSSVTGGRSRWLSFSRVTTPLVWVGVGAILAWGSPLWGLGYGLAFGLGRSGQLFIEYLAPRPDMGERVRRTVFRQAILYRPVGVLVSIGLLLKAIALA